MSRRKQTVAKRGITRESVYFDEFNRFAKKVREKICRLRLEKGLTQEAMQEYELNLRQFQRIERGDTRNITLAYLFRLAEAFGLKPSQLLDV
ncbi:MAG: helix-turn-helix transcriptional regulator [Deltaproteobacteria bacterium]|nr:helix-turn-helix transcriptional regulator [Deltaproteobacteria bacterium]